MSKINVEKEFLTLKQVGDFLGITSAEVEKEFSKFGVPIVIIGGCVKRIADLDFCAFMVRVAREYYKKTRVKQCP